MKAVAAVSLGTRPRLGGAGWLFLVAGLCGLVAAVAATRAVARATDEVDAVVAARPVAPLTRVPADAVRIQRVPASALPPGALRALGGVVGKFTRVGLVPGEVVSGAALSTIARTATNVDARVAAWRASVCAPGANCGHLVGLTLPLDADQGFEMARTGDRVDVVASYGLSGGPVAQVVAWGVPVLARLGNPTGSQLSGSGSASGWLVLGVTASEALRLELLENGGHLAIALEPLGSTAATAGTVGGVLSEAGLAAGAGLPADGGTLPTGSGQGG